jgi:regulator of replication initiation timing
MKKTFNDHSQSFLRSSIFRFSCLFAVCICAQEPKVPKVFDVGIQLKEAQVALGAEKERSAKLVQENATLKKELEALRSRYADLYLRSRQQRLEQQDLELRVAHLLADQSDLHSGEALARAVRALKETGSDQRNLQTAVKEFGIYLNSVLEVLQPSNTLKGEIDSRYNTVRRAVQAMMTPLSYGVARRGSGNPANRSCRVLTVDDDLHVVVLDAGTTAGIRPGANWHVLTDGHRTADLKILETRASISAAMIVRGDLKNVGPGSVVAPE